jgi:hypothetical protein
MESMLHCGHPATPQGVAAGYAVTPDGDKICYACADTREREAMHAAEPGAKVFAYLAIVTEHPTRNTRRITTWTGGTLARVVSMCETKAGFGQSRWYGRAVDPDGRVWSFNSPGPGMYARLRLTGDRL